MYPTPAGAIFSIKLNSDVSIAPTNLLAKASGFSPSFFANSKQREDANWPYSIFGVLLSVIIGCCVSGKTFFNAFANEVWHSCRN
jgi:hypothetical protein